MPGPLEPLRGAKTILLTTYKRDGSAVATPVSIAFDGDRAFFRSYDKAWKTKRLRANPQVEVAPATLRGRPTGPAIPAQARLLCVLAAGPRGMTELAGILGIEKAALTGLADRAEQRGLLVRTPVAGDRRALSLALTPAGRSTAAAFHDDVSAELAALTCVLGPREREQFCRALARITGGRAL